MNNHGKKMIAPIVITIFVVAYYFIYFTVLCMLIEQIWVKALLLIVPILIAGSMIYVCSTRIQEIRSGEEDDLSKY